MEFIDIKKLNTKTIFIALLIFVAGVLLVFQYAKEGSKTANENGGQTEVAILRYTVSAEGKSVNPAEKSFVATFQYEETGVDSTVTLGNGSRLVKLVFPFDVHNPPGEGSFTPKQEPIQIEEVVSGDRVFIRSAESIVLGSGNVVAEEVIVLP